MLVTRVHYSPGGRVGMLNKTTGRYAFELTDHLGNVRAVVAKNASTSAADVLSYTDYYPHGGVLPGRNFVSSPSYKLGYQGQEKDAETNFSNFELRQYDPRLGRWFNPDPMGQYFSPYLAMGNNPVSMTDPTGGFAEDWTEEDQAEWRRGLSADYGNDAWFQGQFSQNYQHGGASWGSITADGQLYSSYEQVNDASELQEKKNKRKAEKGGNPQPSGGKEPDPVITGVMLPTVDIETNGRFSYDVHALVQSIYDNMQFYQCFAKNGVLYMNGIHASEVNGYIGAKVLANGVPVQDVYDLAKLNYDRAVWEQYGQNFNDLADASEVAVIGSFAIAGGGAGFMVATEMGLYTIIVESKIITKIGKIGKTSEKFHSLGAAAKDVFNPKNFKTVSESLLKKAGINDIHAFKAEYLGTNQGLKLFDVVKHTESGELLIIRKSTQEVIERTYIYVK